MDYEGAPIFFTCNDKDEGYYAVVCSDFELAEYLITKTTILSICDMLKGRETIRSFFMNGERFWKANFCDNGALVKFEHIEKKDVDVDVLPAEGEEFLLLTNSAKSYLKKIELLCYLNYEWKNIGKYVVPQDSSWHAVPREDVTTFSLREDYKSYYDYLKETYVGDNHNTNHFSNNCYSDVMWESALAGILTKSKFAPSCELDSYMVRAA